MRTHEVKKEHELIWESFVTVDENFNDIVRKAQMGSDPVEYDKESGKLRGGPQFPPGHELHKQQLPPRKSKAHPADVEQPADVENFWEPDEKQYDKAKQFVDWLTSSHNQAARKYHDAFNDPSANAMDLGREIYGNMSPELQREYDQDVLIDVIEDKLAEAGMRPKESTIQPFDQFYKQD